MNERRGFFGQIVIPFTGLLILDAALWDEWNSIVQIEVWSVGQEWRVVIIFTFTEQSS
jgi:hypothetical protein